MGDVVRRMSWSGAHTAEAELLLRREWLVTNGLGGYASGTIAGVPTRRGSATEVMLADALVLRNLLHLNMISTRKPGQSITCLSLPLPGGPRLALGSRGNAMAFQDIAHRLVTDRVPEVGEGADNPVIAPGVILPRHADDQRFELLVDGGTPGGLTLLGTVNLLRHQFAVPGENRVGFDDIGHGL